MRISRTLAAALPLCLIAQTAEALDTRVIYGPDGRPVLEVRIFGTDDGAFFDDEGELYVSTWNVSDKQKELIYSGIGRWAEILKNHSSTPAIINVGTYDDANAFGLSDDAETDTYLLTQLQALLQDIDVKGPPHGYHAIMALGDGLDYGEEPLHPSPLPFGEGGGDMSVVVFHELAHGLGVATRVGTGEIDDLKIPYFGEKLGRWEANMRDSNGNPAQPAQYIRCDFADCYNGEDWDEEEGYFDLSQNARRGRDQGYVTGPQVRQVMDGAMPGVPVRIGRSFDPATEVDTDYMSHSELERSLMSHQRYRNYTTLMEAELAVLQDMGYDIDRRNFFGHSIYADGREVVNDQGYFRRNESGTAYLPGQYNRATLGMGLHIYGSHNKVRQRADLLTEGAGAVGVRVDGEGNSLVIEEGTRVHANGWNGRGVMFAYGKGHEFVQQGEVTALGRNGIGASFDFGGNLLANELEYRGSYILSKDEIEIAPDEPDFLEELRGPLVARYDLSGTVAGRRAAIYMSRNALVGEINVMRGASIQGDIISEYDQVDETGSQRLTALSFGLRPDAQGRASGRADDSFIFRYDGDIQGQDNLALSFEGGYSALNGEHTVYSVEVAEGAALGGNSHYALHSDGGFLNAGLLSPGNSIGRISIDGDYVQDASGRLLLEFNAAGAHDSLVVSGDATLNGTLALAAEPDWYAQGWRESFALNELVSVGGTFTANQRLATEIASPTLELSAADLGGAYRLSMSRAADAYSSYASNRNARQVGHALDRLVGEAGSDIQPLYQGLDFSSVDGSEVTRALSQLSPEAYSAMVATSLDREQRLTDLVAAQPLTAAAGTLDEGGLQGFAVPLAGGLWQDTRDHQVGYRSRRYGLLFGAQQRLAANPDWTWGLHGAFVGEAVTLKSPHEASGETKAFSLGLQAHYQPDERAGPWLFGQVRAGLEDGEMERQVQAGDYRTRNRADWLGFTGSVAGGGGYLWRLDDQFSLGPVTALSYTRLSRPGETESGDDATRLKLSSMHYNSLRSSFGLRSRWDLDLAEAGLLTSSLQVSWDRELLDDDLTQKAAFVGYGGQDFESRNRIVDRDALSLRAGLEYEAEKNMLVGAHLSSQFLRSGHHSLAGGFSFRWRF